MLYLPVAFPGSGKSYTAEKMVQARIISEDAVVSPDRYREVLTGDRANQDVNKDVFKIVDTIVDNRIARGLDVYLDATNLNPKLRKKLLERLLAISFDFSLAMTVLVSDEPKEVLQRRNVERFHPVPDHVFERFYELAKTFDPERYREAYGAGVMTFNLMNKRCENYDGGEIKSEH